VRPKRQPKRTQKTSAERIDLDRRRAKCLELRIQGMSLRDIAKRVGMHHSSVAEAIEAELAQLTREPAERLREVELERMDVLMKAAWDTAKDGDLNAIDTVLKVMARRAKLLGLDAPTRTANEHTGKDGALLALGLVPPDKMNDEQLDAFLAQHSKVLP
jgi:AcrR family transcriptional regulator